MASTDESTSLVPDGARKAYDGVDTEASKSFHDKRHNTSGVEMHQTEGGMLKPLIFGGLDGVSFWVCMGWFLDASSKFRVISS